MSARQTDKPFVISRDFDAPRELVWKSWTEPERLKHWWGPKGFVVHTCKVDLRPGGRFHYGMSAPDGSDMWGRFVYREIDPPRRLVFIDGFANEDGTPNDDFPRNEGRVTIEPIEAGRTRMSIQSRFPSTEAMQQVLGMGMEEGLTQAVGQIDAILAEEAVQSA